MFADPRKVAARRIRRQLKAGASIVLALAAGAFLACKGERAPDPPSPYGPDARSGPGARRDSDERSDAATAEAVNADGSAKADDATTGATATTALVVRDAGTAAARDARAPHVDKNEHRKGMPVRDNLLE